MKHTLLYDTSAFVICTTLFLFMLVFTAVGFSFGKRILARYPEKDDSSGLIEGSVFALLGLLLAFTYGMSSDRFDARRKLQVEEANNIGTAILRADLYPDSIRDPLRSAFRSYLEARISYFGARRNDSIIIASEKQTAQASATLWKLVTNASKQSVFTVASFHMVPALNSMFDIANSTNLANIATVPDSIIYALLVASLISAFFAGYSMRLKQRSDRLIAFFYCFVIAFVIFICLDLDRPSRGLIKVEIGYQNLSKIKNLLN